MAAPTRGLTPADIGAIREQLAGGRKPRVVFTESAGQIAGQQGHVVSLADPAGSDEWIVVQFGRDELPFSPADLATPIRGGSAKAAAATAATAGSARAATPTPIAAGSARSAAPGRNGASTAAATAGSSRVVSPGTAAANGSSAKRVTAARPQPEPERPAVKPTDAAAKPGPPKLADPPMPVLNGEARPAKVAKPKAPASLTITVSYADREWTVAANLGTRTLAKPYLIKPTEALRLVALIDVPGVHEAVENIIVAERAEAENRAARLRTELAEIESRLAELAGKA
jgi:hypothetical protein